MKSKLYLIAITCLLPAFLSGQEIVWQNHYGGNAYDYLPGEWIPQSNILKNAQGDYIFAAGTSSFDVYANQYALKVNNNGVIIWQINAGNPYELDAVNASIKTYDGNYFMVGFAIYQTPSFNDIRLTKFNDQGDTLFSKIIIGNNEHQSTAHDICYTPDSNYIAACATYHNILLVKLNDNGDTLNTKLVFPIDSIGTVSPVFFQPAPDFSFYYGVLRRDDDLKLFWFKTDTACNLLTIKELVLPGNEDEIFEINKAMMLPNGNIMVHGRGFASVVSDTVCPQPGGYYGVLHEYNPQGELVRERKFCPPLEGGNTYYEYYDDFIVNADGSVYMIRRTRLKKLDANWQDVWEYELDLAPEVNLLKIAQFEPNYLIAAGELWIDIEDTDIFMCKIALPEAIGVEENEEEEFKFNAYPNPTSGQLTLESSLTGTTYYTVIAIDGRLVAQGNFTNKTEIDLVNTSAGAYHLQLQDGEGNRVYGRVISKQ